MKKLVYGLYAIAVVAALCLVVALTIPEPPTPPPATEPTTIPTIPTTAPTEPVPVGEIRLYQCDPERVEVWQALAEAYTQETGIQVTILSSAEADCAGTPLEYLSGDDAATIFCLHHTHELEQRQAYCLDLSGSDIVSKLYQDTFTLKNGDAISGVAFQIESYGIVYNSLLLADAGFTQSDIQDYTALSNVVQNITANKKKLGFSAFSSPDLSSTDHGSLLCLLAGLAHNDPQLRSFWDLYISNCVRSGKKLTQASRDDALKDFLSGKSVFYMGGTWDYQELTKIEDYFLGMMPVYTEGQLEDLGLYHSNTGYWCVNSQADSLDIAVSMDFLNWLVTAQEDAPAPADALQLLMPFRDTSYAGNPLEEQVLRSLESGMENVRWNSCDVLSPELLQQFGEAFKAYTLDPSDDHWAAITALLQTVETKIPEA